jgi:aminoglycoside 3-N-acetyltransferase
MKNRFKYDLNKLGVRYGGNLLVHASLKSLGNIPGGPQTVIQGVLDVLGEEGTLLIAFYWL